MLQNLLASRHLLNFLGFDADSMFNNLSQFQGNNPMLQGLRDSFMLTAGAFGAHALANALQSGGIPAAGLIQPPGYGNPFQYAQPQNFDFGAAPGQFPFSPQAFQNRFRGAQFERLLQADPFARAQVEMMLGGRIIPDGMADGRVQVQPFPNGYAPAGGQHSNAANNAMSFLDQIGRAAAGLGFLNPALAFPAMIAGALANMVGGVQGGGNQAGIGGESILSDWFRGRAPGQGGNANAFAGGGHQAVQGAPGPHQPAFGMHQDLDTTAILNDSSLTVEDKVTLLIMAIMKKMDKDIEKMAEYINDLQQQQGGGGGKGGKGGGGGSSPSIDVETMKLKRLIDKRSQMFDMLRQIIDKYNETAKNIIQSIGR